MLPSRTSIHARVQHHPARGALLPRLLHHLLPFSPEVVEHSSDPPDPWAGYKQCLTNLPDCTHVLVVQDDAMPVPGFAEALPRIAQADPVCLWMSASPAGAAHRARQAMGKQPYIPLRPVPFVPLVAVLWPKETAESFLKWSETASGITRADDGNVARWVRQMPKEEKPQFMVCVPSIVEHDDWTPTVKGGQKETQGRDRARVALFLADDASRYEW